MAMHFLRLGWVAPLAVLGACATRGASWGDDGYGYYDGGFADFDAAVLADPTYQPQLGTTVVAASAPPPVLGGTLMVTKDGTTAVAADPDRDAVYIVDIATRTLTHTVRVPIPPTKGPRELSPSLQVGALPFRVAEDGSHRVHVTLRGTGQLATIDLASGKLTMTRAVCSEPRGVVYEPATDRVHVACDGGQLVSFPAAGGDAVRTLDLQRGLRDVVLASKGGLVVSVFRTAGLLRVESDGTFAPLPGPRAPVGLEPDVAWRTVAATGGNVAMAHQLATTTSLSLFRANAYYGGVVKVDECAPSVIVSAMSVLSDTPPPASTPDAGPPAPDAGPPVFWDVTAPQVLLSALVLPVDVAVSPDASQMLVVSAGSSRNSLLPGYAFVSPTAAPTTTARCPQGLPSTSQFVAAAYVSADLAILQSREPAELHFMRTPSSGSVEQDLGSVTLSSDSREDTGHVVFHANSGGFTACASCHPEGGDDGRVWRFTTDVEIQRRTPSLRGTIAATAPYHWDGQLSDLGALMDEVYVRRMGGPTLSPDQRDAMRHWVESVPAPRAEPAKDPTAVARGQALFAGPAACAQCHSGPKLTNNVSVDVGTGRAGAELFQPPSLIGVSARAPYLHDGCAPTMADRFGICGGGLAHGRASTLSASELSDLMAYLDTL